jgi:hypothetical protein
MSASVLWLSAGMILFVIARHAANIKRLVQGTESNIDFSKKAPSGAAKPARKPAAKRKK